MSTYWFSFSQCFTFLLNVSSSVSVFISVGKSFQKWVPITEKLDWPKVVLRLSAMQLPPAALLVATLLVFIFVTKGHSTAGAILFVHLKISLRKENLIKLSKFKSLYFCTIKQWCHIIGFWSIIFSACLYISRTFFKYFNATFLTQRDAFHHTVIYAPEQTYVVHHSKKWHSSQADKHKKQTR